MHDYQAPLHLICTHATCAHTASWGLLLPYNPAYPHVANDQRLAIGFWNQCAHMHCSTRAWKLRKKRPQIPKAQFVQRAATYGNLEILVPCFSSVSLKVPTALQLSTLSSSCSKVRYDWMCMSKHVTRRWVAKGPSACGQHGVLRSKNRYRGLIGMRRGEAELKAEHDQGSDRLQQPRACANVLHWIMCCLEL